MPSDRRVRPRRTALVVALVVAAVLVTAPASAHAATAPANGTAGRAARTPGRPTALTVDGLAGAVGIDPDGVAFAWHVSDGRPGAVQTASRILVARRPTRDPAAAAVVWDSGTVTSAQLAFVAYAGPRLDADTDYWWTVATAGAAGGLGPFATSARHFVTGLRDADWRASWLRPGPSPPGDEEFAYVRKGMTIGSSPIVRATAYVAAAHKYQLWVDGGRVDSGPSFSYPDAQYYQATDVTRFLHPGRANAIGVLHHWYGAGQGRPLSTPGLLVEISVVHRDGSRELITTDASWREHATEWRPAPPRNDEGDYVERVDGRAALRGWAAPGYDDRSWSPVAVLGPAGTRPFTHLVAQRSRIVEHPVRPVSVRRLRSGAVVADYGAVIAATPAVTFRHGTRGRRIAMRAGFLLDPDGHVSTVHGTQGTDMGYSYVERAGAQTFRGFGFLAFRYLEVSAPHESLTRADLAVDARHAAMPGERPATFHSGNATLDAVWRLTARSALYSAQEQFLDTPTREKGQFLLDAFNEATTVSHAFGEQNLGRQALLDFASSQARFWPDGRVNAVYPNGDGARDIPDFTEQYPPWVWQYFLATGDRATLEALYPVVRNVADYVWRAVDPATGLVTRLPGGGGDYLYGIVDWPPAMRYGYDMKTVARTTMNALAVDLFARVEQIALVLGRSDDAHQMQNRSLAIGDAISARLARPDGIYVDGLEADGSQSPHASQQANAFVLAYVGAPAEHLQAVAGYVASLGIKVGPDNGLVLLRALHRAGHDADVVRVLTDREHPGWAHIVDAGGTFTWETWTPVDALHDSMSHGWGSTALIAFQEVLLGTSTQPPVVRATEQLPAGELPGPLPVGGPALELRAPGAGTPAARGTIPTVAGPVAVAWRRSSGAVRLRLTLPPNATADVHVPARAVSDVTVDGRPATRAAGVEIVGTEGAEVTLRVGAGRYEVRAAGR